MQGKEQENRMNTIGDSPGNVEELVKNLANKDGMIRVKSRHALVSIGEPAVTQLTGAMSHKNQTVRWEATKALGQIAARAAMQESGEKISQNAIKALVKALEDKEFDVRWLAAEGLVSVGDRAAVPILEALETNPDSLILREGAHHVFHDMVNRNILGEKLRAVIKVLEDIDSSVEIPFAAKSVLESLQKNY